METGDEQGSLVIHHAFVYHGNQRAGATNQLNPNASRMLWAARRCWAVRLSDLSERTREKTRRFFKNHHGIIRLP
jgi:hypothetical protein